MINEFLDETGLKYFWGKIKNILTKKQDKLVSGSNISTINGQDITKGGDVVIKSGVGKVDATPDAQYHGEIFNSYEGRNINKATGLASHAEGRSTTANGYFSHAEGNKTTASGSGSHAEGDSTIASGWGSHTEGDGTTASGSGSHAEGKGTTASADYSHAEGRYTTASGSDSHAEGNYTTANGIDSHAEGIGTVANRMGSHAEGSYNKSNTNTISSIGIGTSDEDRKNAFEVMNDGKVYVHGIGDFDGTNPTDTNSLQAVITKAGSGSGSGIGKKDENTVIPPEIPIPEDKKDLLKGEIFNLTEDITIKSGDYQVCYPGNKATGNFSHAEGMMTIANGAFAHAEGQITAATNYGSHAEGHSTIASGAFAHAEGHAGGSYAEETITNIDGNTFTSDHTHEVNEVLSGLIIDNPYEMVVVTNVFGDNVTVDKNVTITDGVHEIMVRKPNAVGDYSHTEGHGTRTNNTAEHAEGSYNKSNTNTISSIGIGTSDEDRKNAFEVMDDGEVYVHGIGGFDGTNPIEANSLQAVIAKGSGVGKVDATPDAVNHGEIFNSYAGDYINKAIGKYSHAEGMQTTARGWNSHAEGMRTIASLSGSHAEGENTTASETGSHAEGIGTIASGQGSHAEGGQYNWGGYAQGTTASGRSSHSEGFLTTASGNYSHAEGRETTASEVSSHAEGKSTTANGYASHVEGIRTVANNSAEHAEGKYNKSNTNTISSIGIGTSDEDRKNAFEVMDDGKVYVHGIGDFDGTNPSEINSLQAVIAKAGSGGGSGVGKKDENTVIPPEMGLTEEQKDLFKGEIFNLNENVNIGDGEQQTTLHANIAHGLFSHAEGFSTIASGVEGFPSGSHAEGNQTQALGNYSHAEGYHTRTNNEAEHAEGKHNKSNTNTISSIGIGTSEGDRKNAFEVMNDGKVYVHGIGDFDGTNPSDTNSLQAVIAKAGSGVGQVDATPDAQAHGEIFNSYEGEYANKATGLASHAEGAMTTASGESSHAEGAVTTASGNGSHAEGYGTTASGSISHAEGNSTTANGFAQTSIGYNNTPEPTPSVDSFDATKLAFVVGGGSDTETKNVFEVFFNGTTKATGTITGATADYAEMFEWIDNNPLGTDRVGRFVNLVGKKIELATKDSKNIIGIISGNPVVLGDAPNSWQGMYINDKWGRPTYTDHEFEIERQKFNKETGKIEKVKEIKKSHARSINQRYDSSLVYTPREERNEWAAVGMLGKLLVLQDGTLNVGDYCYPSQEGIATKSEKGWYVMDIINNDQALVLFK